VSISFFLADYSTKNHAAADVPPSAAAFASVSDVVSTCSGRHCDGTGSAKHTFSSTDALE
jgi:hypothetical protein